VLYVCFFTLPLQLLRPGRLEINVNLGLPNEIGRLAILKAHTKKLREAGFLDDSAVNLLEVGLQKKMHNDRRTLY